VNSSDADHALDRADCRTLAQGLLVFARQLLDDCRRDVREKGTPAEVASQARRLEAMAKRIGQADGMDWSWDGWLAALERGGPYLPMDIPPTDWRTAGVQDHRP
jgi:hypothetical protein